MFEWIETAAGSLFFIFDAQKRIYWLYLLSSLILAVCIKDRQLFAPSLWLNCSSKMDLIWLIINQCLTKLLILPLFTLQVSLALAVKHGLSELFGSGNFFLIKDLFLSCLFALLLFVGHDFSKFLVHLLFHKITFLWRFHAVHHSASTMTPLTLYRIHPVELLVNTLRSLTTASLISGLFIYLFKNNISVFDLLGVNLFVFIFNLCGSNLRHSPVWLGFGKWERLFISPAQHQIHHSARSRHFDKNFGSALSIWDGWFETLMLSKNEQVESFGLDQSRVNRQSFKQQWLGVR
ncbi:sterol desaturase family protein [Psychromonas ossibalaenae]|uniref:sterol desaturase family protein n=1 Tax=Psychromonas ossibalaenae TaxID=444922 RepID=UPI0003808F72|nr:sterol desaturase family protein [Psychromonas ossibalaenae]